jgi:thioredoxin 1
MVRPLPDDRPRSEELSTELDGKVTIAKLNIDDSPDTPAKYGVRGIPTMILFKNGAPAATKVGAARRAPSKAGWRASFRLFWRIVQSKFAV